MANSIVETQITWAAASSKTVSANTIQWSDAYPCDVTDFTGNIQINADNAGTPASGDTCDVYVAFTTGDILGDSGDDFDTDEHAQFLGRLDTYASNTPGEDPARRSFEVELSGKKAFKVGVICAQASTRNIVVRARLTSHRLA